jgi:uncharacterized protein with FMN-binding domain
MKNFIQFIGAVALALWCSLALSGCVDTKSIVIKTPDVAALTDGVYEGKAKVGPVNAIVRIEVASGRIKSFTIVKHDTMLGMKAESLAQLVVERQTLELDAVSGATASSKAILKAGQNALESAPLK